MALVCGTSFRGFKSRRSHLRETERGQDCYGGPAHWFSWRHPEPVGFTCTRKTKEVPVEYRTKSVSVTGIQWDGENVEEVLAFIPEGSNARISIGKNGRLYWEDAERIFEIVPGNRVLRNDAGEYTLWSSTAFRIVFETS